MSGSRWAVDPPGERDDPPADPEQVARTILLRRLEAAPRTRAQLATTLRERNVPDDVAQRVLDRFEEVGLIDDRAFACMWVESRQRGRRLAGRALRSELRSKGVCEPFIDEALALVSPEDELAAAREVAARKARSVVGLPRVTQVRRLSGALARKGYGPGLTAQVIREALTDAHEQCGPPGAGAADPGAGI
ncbi:MAG TPA: regulatory protein RecX [Dermatophilaceae bacterium]|nr:regulatory protein RecX [Dermatophilaceae bacterium]